MAVETLAAGTLAATWTAAFNAADLQSLAYGSSSLSTIAAFDNSSIGDEFGAVDFICTTLTIAAPGYMALYLLPADSGGTVFGDGVTGVQTAPPPPQYLVRNGIMRFRTGSTVPIGVIQGIELPRSKFKFSWYNLTTGGGGAALPSSGVTSSFISYNRQVV